MRKTMARFAKALLIMLIMTILGTLGFARTARAADLYEVTPVGTLPRNDSRLGGTTMYFRSSWSTLDTSKCSFTNVERYENDTGQADANGRYLRMKDRQKNGSFTLYYTNCAYLTDGTMIDVKRSEERR